jgi:hypothetical protein
MPAARIVPQRNYFGLLCGQVARSESMCSLTRRWHTVSIGAFRERVFPRESRFNTLTSRRRSASS